MSGTPKQKRTGGARLSQSSKGRPPMDQKTKEKLIMVVMIILAVIMVVAAAVSVLYTRWVKKPDLPPTSDYPSVTQPGTPTASPSGSEEDVNREPEYDPVQPKVSGERKSEDIYTIFVFGADESSDLTDTMMLVTYDITNQKATVMSIPRDTLINTKAFSVDAMKMNCVYSRKGGGEKGIKALVSEVSELVGYTPDYYVKVNWDLVGLMVDAIGGVYFDIPWDMWYSDPYQDLYIDLQAGYQLLNGNQAMQLVRWRKNMNKETFSTSGEKSVGDTGRLEIQQNFLKSVLKQTLQLKNAARVSELAKLFGENVESNLTIENLFWFGSQAIFSGLSVENVEFVTMPFYFGEYPVKSGENWQMRSFVYPGRKDLIALINNSLNPFLNEVTTREVDLIYTRQGGGIASTTGVLADPSMETYPEEYVKWKFLQDNPDLVMEPDGVPDPNNPYDPDNPENQVDPENPGNPDDPGSSGVPGGNEDPGYVFDPNVVPTDPGWSSGGDEPVETSEPQPEWDPNAVPTDPGWVVTDPVESRNPGSDGEPTE